MPGIAAFYFPPSPIQKVCTGEKHFLFFLSQIQKSVYFLGLVSYNILTEMYLAGVDLVEEKKWKTLTAQVCTYAPIIIITRGETFRLTCINNAILRGTR